MCLSFDFSDLKFINEYFGDFLAKSLKNKNFQISQPSSILKRASAVEVRSSVHFGEF